MPHGDITHHEIPVADLEKAKTFYADLFGWQISAPPGFETYPMWQAPNKISGGGLVGRDEAPAVRSYVEVDSIEETLAKVTAGGGTVVVPRSEISPTSWYAVFTDPDGNELGLYEGTTETP
ncbi:VOC family protein [Dermacoccaceae bacterium W4C1]